MKIRQLYNEIFTDADYIEVINNGTVNSRVTYDSDELAGLLMSYASIYSYTKLDRAARTGAYALLKCEGAIFNERVARAYELQYIDAFRLDDIEFKRLRDIENSRKRTPSELDQDAIVATAEYWDEYFY